MPKKKKSQKLVETKSSIFAVPKANVANVCRNNVARWETTVASTNRSVLADNLIASLNLQASTTSVLYSTFFAVKLRKIIFYLPAVVSSGTSEYAFEWIQTNSNGNIGVEPVHISSGTLGTAAGTVCVEVPPKNTFWANWMTLLNPGAVAIFQFTAPAGTTIDIIYDAYVDSGDGSKSVNLGVASAAVGSNYRMGLDLLAQTGGTGPSVYKVLGLNAV